MGKLSDQRESAVLSLDARSGGEPDWAGIGSGHIAHHGRKLPQGLGMSPQKAVRRAYQRNDVAIANWLSEEYPAIARQAWHDGATIFGATRWACQ
jgi:hypothetical protein